MGSLSFLQRQRCALCAAACLLAVGGLRSVQAAGFATGDLVVVQVGNATEAASDVELLGYQVSPTTASADTTIDLPTANGAALTLLGTEDHDGEMSLSSNGQYLALGVYRYNVGSTDPSALAASAAPRDIITVDGAGTVNIAASLTNSYNGMDVRSVATPDGKTFYLAGNDKGTDATAGIQYVNTAVSTSASVSLNNTAPHGFDGRTVTLFDGNLYVSSGSSNGPFGPGVGADAHTTGTASGSNSSLTLPTANPVTYTGFNNNVTTNMNQSPAFFSLVPGDDGSPDVMYVSNSTNSRLDKWSLVSGTWILDGSVGLGAIEDVDARLVGSTVQIYVTTATNVFGLADSNGWDANFSSTSLSTLLTATGNEQFRGLAFAPNAVPEPASLGLIVLGGLALLRRRRA